MDKWRRPLDGNEVPQANQLFRVLALVRSSVAGESLDSSVSERDRAYYSHAAQLLGLLDDGGGTTALGRVVVGLESESVRAAVLREAFCQTLVARRWLAWARVERLEEVDPTTAAEFLHEESVLAEATVERRGLTLRKWWLTLCSAPRQSERPSSHAADVAGPRRLAALDWNALAGALDARQRDLPLARLELPARIRSLILAEELDTVGDLLALRREELMERPNLGRRSIEDARQAMVAKLDALASSPATDEAFSLDAFSGVFGLWRERIMMLPSQLRLVITHRTGVHGRAMTLEELGSLLGVTRERARQLERDGVNRLVRDDAWAITLRSRLAGKLVEGAITLAELERDRWFADVDSRVDEFRFIVERVLDADLRVFSISGAAILTLDAESEVRQAEQRLRRALQAAHYPMQETELEGVLAGATSVLSPGVARLVVGRIEEELQRIEGPRGREVVAFGSSRTSQVLAYVRGSAQPVSVRALEERFGRSALPRSLIHVGRGLVWVAERVPGFAVWQQRLTPLCIAVMQQDDAERQWAAYELLEEVRGSAQLPEWLNHWHLWSMLRESTRLVDLGRLRFRLATEGVPEGRLYVRELALEELARAGEPLSKQELMARVKQRGAVHDLAVGGLLSRLPFVMVAEDRWGLVERDVPGGASAFAHALEAIEEGLRERERGLSSVESTAFVRTLSPEHACWTPEMVRSLARASAMLRGSANGSIGLAALVNHLPAQNGGRAPQV